MTLVPSEFPRVHILSNAISQIVSTQVFHLSEREALIIEFPRDAMETCRRYTKEVRGRYGTSKRAGEQLKHISATTHEGCLIKYIEREYIEQDNITWFCLIAYLYSSLIVNMC